MSSCPHMKGFCHFFFSGLLAAWIAPGFGSVGWAENAVSPTPASPVHLAIVSAETKLTSAVDLLTVELSGRSGVALLERSQIDKVLSELALSANGGGDYVKLGEILGAD